MTSTDLLSASLVPALLSLEPERVGDDAKVHEGLSVSVTVLAQVLYEGARPATPVHVGGHPDVVQQGVEVTRRTTARRHALKSGANVHEHLKMKHFFQYRYINFVRILTLA